MPRYQEPELNELYERLIKLGTPQALEEAKIFGYILSCFKIGYAGRPRPYYVIRDSLVWAAYYAGKDCARIKSA